MIKGINKANRREKNIFVIGMSEYHRHTIKSTDEVTTLKLHNLIHNDELRGVDEMPVAELLDKARSRLDSFNGSIDAIVTFLDFPALEIMATLGREYNCKTPRLENLLKCNHKYWSRELQKQAAPEAIPKFSKFNPYDEDPLSQINLDYPFWIKPVNAYRSHLGFRINGPEDFENALPVIKEELPRISEPFKFFLDKAELPGEIGNLDHNICLAEDIISGKQCTVEGFVYERDITIYGVVDSIRDPNRSSFSRYQYPSSLPSWVQDEMTKISEKVIKQVGFRNGTFNIEFFFDRDNEKFWLLEINPRMSQSHGELFEKVDGTSNHKIMIDLALGQKPEMPYREGDFKVAGKFFLRSYEDAMVVSVPGKETVKNIEKEIPGTTIELHVDEGTQLSDLQEQDSYSYELASIWLGADSQRELQRKYNMVMDKIGVKVRAKGRTKKLAT